MTSLTLSQAQQHSVEKGDFLAKARELGSKLADRASACERNRRVPEETIADFAGAGFFDMLKPRQFGGHELDPLAFLEVCIEVSRHCASSGWVLGILGAHVWRLALFPDRAAAEVWNKEQSLPELIAASSPPPPESRVQTVENGYRISGHWAFASGVDHCGWALLAADVPVSENSRHTFQYFFLVPRSDFEIHDVWHAAGLKGTGTNVVVVDDAFVPDYRTSSEAEVLMQRMHSMDNKGATYRYPWGLILSYIITAPVIGMADAALDRYVEFVKGKLRGSARDEQGDPFAHLLIARTRTTLDCVQMRLRQNFDDMARIITEAVEIPLELRARCRWEASWMTECSVDIIRSIFDGMGGRAILDDNTIQRLLRDAQAVKAHRINNTASTGSNFGRLQVGLANKEFFL